jgi:hypothetical protein
LSLECALRAVPEVSFRSEPSATYADARRAYGPLGRMVASSGGCYTPPMRDEMDDLAAEGLGTPASKQPGDGVRAIIVLIGGTVLVLAFSALTWLLFHHPT